MVKAIRTESASGNSIFGLIETIDRLSPAHRERMHRIILLLADAPTAVQEVVQEMLGRFLQDPPRSAVECLAEVDAVLAYLEHEGGAEQIWDSPRSAAARLAALRYN